jgi:hypothetical protein
MKNKEFTAKFADAQYQDYLRGIQEAWKNYEDFLQDKNPKKPKIRHHHFQKHQINPLTRFFL